MTRRAVMTPPPTPTVRYVEHVMNLPISLALRGRHTDDGESLAAWHRVMDELREVDLVFSTYRQDSYISRLGRDEIGLPDCPPEVTEVMRLGEQAGTESGGAFSVWRPCADGTYRLDPSGVVKGWAIERAARHLRDLDGTDFCLSAGGDMVCHTDLPTAAPWQVGIEDPFDAGRIWAVVPVANGAVATSATTHRGDHLTDARTSAAPTGIASVTVIAGSLTWADIDATAAYAQGKDAARWLSTRPGRTALVIWSDGSSELVPPVDSPLTTQT
jgi:thiamine biosynthesis lipoprotein